jgi:hypothetical protein
MDLKQALARLDPADDDHWTADGLPRVDAVSMILGRDVKRAAITDAAPGMTRETFAASGFPPIGHEPEADPSPKTPDPTPTPEPGVPEQEPTTPPAEPEQPAEAPMPEPATEPAAEPKVTPDADGPGTEETPESPPMEDTPQQHAEVEAFDDVVGMSPSQVYNDIDLVDRAIEEFARQAVVLGARKEAIVKALAELSQRSVMLSRARNILLRRGAKPKQATPIQDYLRRSQEARAKRAKQAQAFIAAGTNADDVIEQLEGPSKVDAAMKARRQRGAQRPVYPVRVGQ